MTVKNTRLLRGRVQADVGLGSCGNGSFVGVQVEIDLTNPAIKAAVTELHRVIEEQAMEHVAEAMADRAKWKKAETARRKRQQEVS